MLTACIILYCYKWKALRLISRSPENSANPVEYSKEVMLVDSSALWFWGFIIVQSLLDCVLRFYHHYTSIRKNWQANYSIILFPLFSLAGKWNKTTKSSIKTVKSKQVNRNHVKYFVHTKVDTILDRTNQLIRQVWKILLSNRVAVWKHFLRAKHLFFIYKKNLALQGFYISHKLTVIIQLLQ